MKKGFSCVAFLVIYSIFASAALTGCAQKPNTETSDNEILEKKVRELVKIETASFTMTGEEWERGTRKYRLYYKLEDGEIETVIYHERLVTFKIDRAPNEPTMVEFLTWKNGRLKAVVHLRSLSGLP